MIRQALATIGFLALLVSGAVAASTDLRIGLPSEPASLDPTASSDIATVRVAFGNIFEALVRVDENGRPQAWLAEGWELSPDGLGLRVTVRPDVRFHDGSLFEADDAVFSLRRQIGPNPDFSTVARVEVVDPRTFDIALSQPDAEILRKLASPAAVMVAPESADSNGSEPIGTGPFALFDWFTGDRLILERNETYWGEHPKIVKASLVFFLDGSAGVTALQMGDVDGLAHVGDAAMLARLQGVPGLFVTSSGAWKVGIEGVPVEMAEDWLDLRTLRWGD